MVFGTAAVMGITVAVGVVGAASGAAGAVGFGALKKKVSNENMKERAGFKNKDVWWVREKKYMVSCDPKDALNTHCTVRRGAVVSLWKEPQNVAVKKVDKCKRMEKELKALMGLDHKNVVKFIDFESVNESGFGTTLYIIMELVETNLTTFMEQKKNEAMSIHAFENVSKQLLAGLAYIHGKRLIHRDIKPDNILIDDGTFKFSDFGISEELAPDASDVTVTRDGVGSDGYRAPESYAESAILTQAIDIFSLAIVLAQLTSKGKHPYGPDKHDWKPRIRKGDIDLSNISIEIPERKRQLKVLLTKMLSVDPSVRPAVLEIRNQQFFKNLSHGNTGRSGVGYENTTFVSSVPPCGTHD